MLRTTFWAGPDFNVFFDFCCVFEEITLLRHSALYYCAGGLKLNVFVKETINKNALIFSPNFVSQ